MSGTLILRIIKGELLRDTDLIGKMDPYVIIKHENNDEYCYTTNKSEGGGKNPKWDEILCIRSEIN